MSTKSTIKLLLYISLHTIQAQTGHGFQPHALSKARVDGAGLSYLCAGRSSTQAPIRCEDLTVVIMNNNTGCDVRVLEMELASSPEMLVALYHSVQCHIPDGFFVIKPTRCTNFTNLFGIKLYMFRTVPLSIIRSLFTVHSATVYVVQVCRQLSSPARKLSTNLYDIYHC